MVDSCVIGITSIRPRHTHKDAIITVVFEDPKLDVFKNAGTLMGHNITAPEERGHLRGKQTEGEASLPPPATGNTPNKTTGERKGHESLSLPLA
jgi:hypothetical protein